MSTQDCGKDHPNLTHSRRLKAPPQAKLFVAIMSGSPAYAEKIEKHLERRWGAIDHRSEIYCFSEYTSHYEREMGQPIWKYFVTFRRPRPVPDLVQLKLFTEELEQMFLTRPIATGVAGNEVLSRTVNLDPGYLTAWHLVLATVKNYAHRVHLQDGIYSELTLLFRRSKTEPLPWTYPDYRAEATLRFFSGVRSDYLSGVAEQIPGPEGEQAPGPKAI